MFLTTLVAVTLLGLIPAPAAAEIYRCTSRTNPDILEFTDSPKRGLTCKRLAQFGPGKASVARGNRVDRRPASDTSKDRFSRYDMHIQAACALYQIPVALARAVIWVESDYDPRVVSRAGAEGLMQLMPSISKGMGVDNPFDPRQNIFGGVKLLRILANRFEGDLQLTIAAYHAGSGAVRKYKGIPPYETTVRYLRWVITRYHKLRKLEIETNKQKMQSAALPRTGG